MGLRALMENWKGFVGGFDSLLELQVAYFHELGQRKGILALPAKL